ncbi:MAG TPA: histidine phosphatase family protein [Chloroflexia bacterium]|nr:histidine phosphatase family protein [Chloroflexia bacterium]
MNTLKLILLRHGRTAHNFGLRLTGWGDPDLDELGREQAEAAAQRLVQEFDIETIYSSPLKRARQTAEPLVRLTGHNPHIRDGLKELNFGEVEGLTMEEIREKHPQLFVNNPRMDDPDFTWPGGESRLVFHTRVDKAMWEIIKHEAGKHKTVAVVAHGGSIAGFVAELKTGKPFVWRDFLLDNCQHYVVDVHFEQLPLEREEVKLEVAYTGRLVPLAPDK